MFYYLRMGALDESSLEIALSALPADVQKALSHHDFDRNLLLSLARKMRAGTLENVVQGTLEEPTERDVVDLPAPGSATDEEYRQLGEAALREGTCAMVVLAGGMATRMGGVVKALVEALPGRTFLDLRLAEQESLAQRYGARPPLWLMTSHATDEPIRNVLGERRDGEAIATFVQGLSVRLTPEGQLLTDEEGKPSLYSPGHGDLPDALRRSGLLTRFVKKGGKYVLVTNLDNLGGGLDPTLIGMHLSGRQPVTCEVVDKLATDRGGIPVRLEGMPVVLEEFRIPTTFDPSQVRVFNVNSFGFDASTLDRLQMDWTYFRVEKKVAERPAIQFERLINEVTFQLSTLYVRVPREGARSRFLPVKDHDELARRQQEISQLAQARGMLRR